MCRLAHLLEVVGEYLKGRCLIKLPSKLPGGMSLCENSSCSRPRNNVVSKRLHFTKRVSTFISFNPYHPLGWRFYR